MSNNLLTLLKICMSETARWLWQKQSTDRLVSLFLRGQNTVLIQFVCLFIPTWFFSAEYWVSSRTMPNGSVGVFNSLLCLACVCCSVLKKSIFLLLFPVSWVLSCIAVIQFVLIRNAKNKLLFSNICVPFISFYMINIWWVGVSRLLLRFFPTSTKRVALW